MIFMLQFFMLTTSNIQLTNKMTCKLIDYKTTKKRIVQFLSIKKFSFTKRDLKLKFIS